MLYRLLPLTLVVIGAAGCSELSGLNSPRDSSAPACIIQAHRGAGELAPENTLPSFELAWQLGVVPEADVRTTRDGVIVAFHDKDFKRIVKGASPELAAKGVADLTWEDLSRLDMGAYKGKEFEGQHAPKIEDVFAAMRSRPGRLLYLDIKDVDLQRLAELAQRYNVAKKVILASTDDSLIHRWKELLPQSGTLLWMGGNEAKLTPRLRKLRESGFADVTQLQIHVIVGDLNSSEPFDPSSAFLKGVAAELEDRNILFQVLPKNTHDPRAYTKLMELGVDSFATDDPKIAVKATDQYLSRRAK